MTPILQRNLNVEDFLTQLSSRRWLAVQMQDLNLSASEACGPSTALNSTFGVWAPVILQTCTLCASPKVGDLWQ